MFFRNAGADAGSSCNFDVIADTAERPLTFTAAKNQTRARARHRASLRITAPLATAFVVLVSVFMIVLPAGQAQAACSPAAASNETATCTGATTNQGGGAPGTSTGINGFGTGVETGITVNVTAGAGNTVTGSNDGISIGAGSVTNNAGASITGANFGVLAISGAVNVINAGSIVGTAQEGIAANTSATVTNNTGGSITGGTEGITANTVTVTNNAGASITGGVEGIHANTGAANVINSGSITGTTDAAIFANTNATVTNNAGASITGGNVGVDASTGAANVINSGNITGTIHDGIFALTSLTVINNAGASITGGIAGVIAGAGGSSVFNAGTITGPTAIQFFGTGNTLTLAPGSAITGHVLGTGADTFQLGGSGAATFDVSQLGPVAQYEGFGTFNKIGASTWTLTGTSTFAGPVNVNGGTLAVNGNIASASSLTVNAGGTLAGSGTVGKTQINAGGIFAPGNGTPGSSMTVAGNLAFQSGAMYLVQLNSVTSSLANVTGTAALAGTVGVSSATGSYRFNSGYTILTSAGLNGTRFDNLAPTPVGIAGSLIYTANNVLLNLTSALGQIAGLNNNQRAVGAALDTAFNASGSNSGALGAIFSGNVPQNLTQASGELATATQQTTFDAMNLFMGLMTDPFGRDDGLAASTGVSGYADEQALGYAQARKSNDALAAIYTKAPRAAPFEPRWNIWASGYGGSQTTDGNAVVGSNNTTSSVFGSAVGADYRFSPNTIAGFALAGGGTNFSVNGSGSGHSDLFQAGAFVRHTIGPAYISAALAYGWQDITTNRSVTIGGTELLRAQFDANAYSGRVEGGYRFVTPYFGGVGITPYAAGQFTTFDLPAYAEQALSGASTFALGYGARDVTDPRSELGIRADKSYGMANGVLTLRGRVAWAYDYDPNRSIGATFQTLPGASFVVNGAAQAHDSALTTASVEMKWLNGWSAAATFEGEFSNVTSSYAGKGVVRYTW
jgi:uncharacterized protein with beta-barrel porin domain